MDPITYQWETDGSSEGQSITREQHTGTDLDCAVQQPAIEPAE